MNKKEDKSPYLKPAPTLKEVCVTGAAWVCQRWNLLWLVPDLALFAAMIVLASAYLPQAIALASEYGDSEWSRRVIQALATGALSALALAAVWRGSKWLCRHNWGRRDKWISPFAVFKSGLLVSIVAGLNYNGAAHLLFSQLALPLRPATAVVSKFCEARNASNSQMLVKQEAETDLATPVIEAAYRKETSTPDKRATLARMFLRLQERYAWMKFAAELNSLPTGLLAGLVVAESNGDERAVSPMGAKGLMQLMPINYSGHNPFHPVTNVELGARMLRRLIDEHSDTASALAYYNASHRANEEAKKIAETIGASNFWQRREFLPEETREYVPRVLGYQIAWEEWEKYGRVRSFEERHGLKLSAKPQGQKRRTAYRQYYVVKKGDTVGGIALHAGVDPARLKRANPGLVSTKLQIGQVLRLPSSS